MRVKLLLLLNTEGNLFFFFKELHNKDLQTLKKSHQEQTRTAENMMQNLVSNFCFCFCTISVAASFTY